jgi:hypothetical protein
MPNTVNSIVEGCMPDTPEKLVYCSLELQIPENSVLLTYADDARLKWLLYARTNDFTQIEIANNPDFSSLGKAQAYEEIKRRFQKGFPIDSIDPRISRTYDAQRSFTTKDGRIYVETAYFHQDWRWYLDAVPTIIRECGKIFRGEKTEEYYYNNPSRAF